MIVLFTDFGLEGPYVGQMKAVLQARAPAVPVIDLFADVPAFEPQLAAYLLAAYAGEFAEGTVFLCVVDPGVGSARPPVIAEADGRKFVGPGNGVFEIVLRRAMRRRWRCIDWRPERLSASFHGRDLFAPAAAMLAMGQDVPATALPFDGARPGADWPDDLARIVYIDGYGNAMTGWRASATTESTRVRVGDCAIERARTFSDVKPGQAFWYENANGLVEIAVNRGRASDLLGLGVGAAVAITT